MPVTFFDLKKQYQEIKAEIDEAVSRVIESGRYILGENVEKLEAEIAEYCGAKYAIGVASGTDALHLSLRALDIKEGDEVITSPFTFIATAEAISYVGATPIFVDIEPKTYNIEPSKIEAKITKKTKAIIPVHLFGLPADMDSIMEIAKKHNLKIIEDAAQAIGAEYKGKKVGAIGDTGCFSFFPTKNLGCFGDGGMVLTNDNDVAEKVRMLRVHGSAVQYHHDILGFNSRLDEIQATILRVKLRHLEKWISRRQKNARVYNDLLKDAPVAVPTEMPRSRHVYHQYSIRVENRDRLKESLKQKGIGTMVYYPVSLHLQKVYAHLYKKGDFPVAENIQEEILSLPIFPELKEEELKEVVSAIRSFYK